LQEETMMTQVVDPWGGSYMMESLTQEMADKAWAIIEEVDRLGGMAKYIETGLPKLNIEKSAALKQARIDRGEDVIVGVNKYKLKTEEPVEILEVDNNKVLHAQLERLKNLKASRDEKKVQIALEALSNYAQSGTGNGLELAVNAARLRATVGEISSALEKHWGRYVAQSMTVSGVYGQSYQQDEKWKNMKERIENFIKVHGRRPRILIAKMGQDGHDRGAKVVATGLADLGFDVDLSPLFSTPKEVAKQAVENDVHFVAASSLAAGHKTLVPELINELKALGADDIHVIVGGVVPKQDYDFLFAQGVAKVFGPGSSIPETADEMLKLIEKN
jgi:methylmalonyl-CoA mutase